MRTRAEPRFRATVADLMKRPEIREKFNGDSKALRKGLGRYADSVHWFDYRVRFGNPQVCRGLGICFGKDVVFDACTAVGPHADIGANSRIMMGAVIGSFATVEPDVTVGPYVFIGHDATIHEGAVIGARAFVDPLVEIDRRIQVGSGAQIGFLAKVMRDVVEMEMVPACRTLCRKD
jgi:serine acetyltransferase